ncbi:MAG: outer rane receptor protein [Hydrocarboniphaga sp.]|nr:outer rane receptor protein [Hydrocarboniphaga sp.]
MKADFFDHLLRFNSAVFDNRIKNKQVGFVSLISGGAVSLGNAEKTDVKGAEFDLTLVPLADWDPGLVITANGAFLNAKYKKYSEGQGYNETTGIYQNNQDFSGARVERTPRWSGGLGISQTLGAGSNGEVELAADTYYNSGFYYSAENKPDYKEDAYQLVNAHVSYRYLPWQLRLTAFGKNIFDETYHISKFQTDFGILSTLAYGVQYGLIADLSF